ncbi:unnamed protein product [Prunus armeniaca]|uniref:Uncharacterized protein n=1 Tax=Prunus armeniaca TaxID=36596 RepID=A0A6J5TIQ2_PRUAR|nr:unnamed protein product [Prunus armeniaca]
MFLYKFLNYFLLDPSGVFLASVSEDYVRVWSFGPGSEGKCIHELYSTDNKFHCCVFHPWSRRSLKRLQHRPWPTPTPPIEVSREARPIGQVRLAFYPPNLILPCKWWHIAFEPFSFESCSKVQAGVCFYTIGPPLCLAP